ncbi:PRC-barrel domain containing protein [Roseomonas sp. M0104]|uniref:PRC-barrel domain containing protein n=1 Tax=Teichococcus coralli TaxID=2545983 RepID=A0A845BAP3_9PROT|nr:PRC-barrel domain-containing protein [Pseudoroseomonas coralli]MXP62437.1 PRC-barrel domain containing protein [Pseudoroseomonas coralli]
MIPRLALPCLAFAVAAFAASPAAAQQRDRPEASVTSEALRQPGPPLPASPTVSADNLRWRASDLMGADVYSSENNKLGSVKDLLFTRDGGLTVVLSSGGLFGIGERLVAIPFQDLQHSERWVLPGSNAETLRQRPEFHYDQSRG